MQPGTCLLHGLAGGGGFGHFAAFALQRGAQFQALLCRVTCDQDAARFHASLRKLALGQNLTMTPTLTLVSLRRRSGNQTLPAPPQAACRCR